MLPGRKEWAFLTSKNYNLLFSPGVKELGLVRKLFILQDGKW